MELAIIKDNGDIIVIVKEVEKCDFEGGQSVDDFKYHVVEMVLREIDEKEKNDKS